jgi:hypothetical protein
VNIGFTGPGQALDAPVDCWTVFSLELGWAGIKRVAVDGLQKSIEFFLGSFALRFEKSEIRSTLVLESKRSLKG